MLKFKHLFLLILTIVFVSCRTGAKIADQAVTTPNYFSENKVLFVSDEETKTEKRNLKFGHEISIDSSNEIKKLEPIGCIVRGVRIPDIKEFNKEKDIAVVVDIVTAGSNSLESLVVFYQRNVKGGQMLNFQDLLVYYEPEWDGITPPYFRVRLLDVKSERNTRTQDFLDKANNMTASLSGIIPHPVLPGVQTAIEAAKLIFGNSKNEVLLDYQVQFYSPAQIEGSNTKLLPLRRGEWIVVGRQLGEKSNFWTKEFFVNQKTGELMDSLKNIPVPYVSLVMMSADAVIPKHIMDRSKILIELLESNSERNNIDALENSIKDLNTSVTAYKLERRLKKYMSSADFEELVDVLIDTSITLNTEQNRRLFRIFNQLTNNSIYSGSELTNWWDTDGNSKGKLIEVRDQEQLEIYPLKYKWVKNED